MLYFLQSSGLPQPSHSVHNLTLVCSHHLHLKVIGEMAPQHQLQQSECLSCYESLELKQERIWCTHHVESYGQASKSVKAEEC